MSVRRPMMRASKTLKVMMLVKARRRVASRVMGSRVARVVARAGVVVVAVVVVAVVVIVVMGRVMRRGISRVSRAVNRERSRVARCASPSRCVRRSLRSPQCLHLHRTRPSRRRARCMVRCVAS